MSSTTNPYASAHAHPAGAGDARPTAMQIIHDEGVVNSMTDKVMLVTGASSGIGVETVRALHATGAKIFMQVRDMAKGAAVREEILGSSEGTGGIELVRIELDSFASVRAGAAEVLGKSGKLNVLINNAGVRNTPYGITPDGFETQLATNHLSHFLLTSLLLPALLASTTPAFASRVITLTSGSHRASPFHFANPNLEGIYTPRLGYAQSKTANILFSTQLERLYASRGVHGIAVHPGAIWTGLQKHDDAGYVARVRENKAMRLVEKSVAQGAATSVWAAVGRVWEGKGGVYLEDVRVGVEVEEPDLVTGGYKAWAFDEEAGERLWVVSLGMVGLAGGG